MFGAFCLHAKQDILGLVLKVILNSNSTSHLSNKGSTFCFLPRILTLDCNCRCTTKGNYVGKVSVKKNIHVHVGLACKRKFMRFKGQLMVCSFSHQSPKHFCKCYIKVTCKWLWLNLQNGTEQLFTHSKFTAHLHRSLLSHHDNGDVLAAQQKICTEVIQSQFSP